jgi:hypothetical protein
MESELPLAQSQEQPTFAQNGHVTSLQMLDADILIFAVVNTGSALLLGTTNNVTALLEQPSTV